MVKSSLPRTAYMRHWTRSAFVQIMACRLMGAKPLSKPVLENCPFDHSIQTSPLITHLKISSAKCGHLVQGGFVNQSQWLRKTKNLTSYIAKGICRHDFRVHGIVLVFPAYTGLSSSTNQIDPFCHISIHAGIGQQPWVRSSVSNTYHLAKQSLLIVIIHSLIL